MQVKELDNLFEFETQLVNTEYECEVFKETKEVQQKYNISEKKIYKIYLKNNSTLLSDLEKYNRLFIKFLIKNDHLLIQNKNKKYFDTFIRSNIYDTYDENEEDVYITLFTTTPIFFKKLKTNIVNLKIKPAIYCKKNKLLGLIYEINLIDEELENYKKDVISNIENKIKHYNALIKNIESQITINDIKKLIDL